MVFVKSYLQELESGKSKAIISIFSLYQILLARTSSLLLPLKQRQCSGFGLILSFDF